jgi:hypothetical protein
MLCLLLGIFLGELDFWWGGVCALQFLYEHCSFLGALQI